MLTLRLRLMPMAPDDTADEHMDEVLLADGQVLAVPRGNLAAAKAALAARKAAARRVGGTRAPMGAPYPHRGDTTGLDSGVRPVEARLEEMWPWLRAEDMRAELAS